MTDVMVPALGESVSEATVSTWFKKPGDAVKQDEMLCELETDKVSVEVPSPVAGVLAEILAPEGTTVAANARLAIVTEGAAAAEPKAGSAPNAPPVSPAAKAAEPKAEDSATVGSPGAGPEQLTPRTDVYWIDLDDEPERIAREIADCPYSRIVVARGGDIGKPVGIVQKKDLLTDLIAGKPLRVEENLIQPLFVPETLPVLRLLEMFRTANVHIALVVDEYGDFTGVATLHDVLEGIAGDIAQEHEGAATEITKRADGSWLVDGRAPIEALKEELGIDETPDDYHTAAGLALEKLARIPVEGDSFVIGDWRVEVIDMDGKRIDKLIFIPLEPAKAAE